MDQPVLFPGYSKKIYIHPPHQQDDHSCCSGCPECIPCLWKVAHQSSQKYTFKAILERRHTLSGTSPPDRLHAKGKPVVFFYPLGEGARLCRQLAKPWRLQEEPRTPKPAPHGKPPRAQAGAAAGTAAREPAGQSAHRGRGGARLSSRREGRREKGRRETGGEGGRKEGGKERAGDAAGGPLLARAARPPCSLLLLQSRRLPSAASRSPRPRARSAPQGLRTARSCRAPAPRRSLPPVRPSLPHSLHFQSASPFKPRRCANPFRAAPLPPPSPPAGCGRPPDFLPFLRLPTRAPRAPPLARPTLTPFPIAAVVCAPRRVLLFRE